MLHFHTISDLRRASGFPPPEHPQISLLTNLQTCPLGGQEFTTDCYIIAYKKIKAGVMLYGRTVYDHSNGCLFFIKPRQVLQFTDLDLEEESFMICLHEDYFIGHHLHKQIEKYHYFDYETTEALHLSPREERTIWDLYHQIARECDTNPDDFSREIILTHLDSILKYALRFYKRQFVNRAVTSGKMVSKFQAALAGFYESGALTTGGLPSVNQIAQQLNISPRYLSDLLKQETGKTAGELIHISLIQEAKHRLRDDDKNVSEVAFALGFDNLSYFSKLFKREAGLSPTEFKKQLLN